MAAADAAIVGSSDRRRRCSSSIGGSIRKKESCLGSWVAALLDEHKATGAGGAGAGGLKEGGAVVQPVLPLPLLSLPSPGEFEGGSPPDDLLTGASLEEAADAGLDYLLSPDHSHQAMVTQQKVKERQQLRLQQLASPENGCLKCSGRHKGTNATAAAVAVAAVGQQAEGDVAVVAEELGRLATVTMALHGCCCWRSVAPTGAGYSPWRLGLGALVADDVRVPKHKVAQVPVHHQQREQQERVCLQAIAAAAHREKSAALAGYQKAAPSTLVEDKPCAELGRAVWAATKGAGAAEGAAEEEEGESGGVRRACGRASKMQLLPVSFAALAHLPLHCAVAWRLLGLVVAVEQRQV